MPIDFLSQRDCSFTGPALPEPFVRFELERALSKRSLLPTVDGLTGQTFRDQWEVLRRKFRDISPHSGPIAIANRLLEPLVSRLGYQRIAPTEPVMTREGEEDGGLTMTGADGATLRCWSIEFDADLDAPTKRGYAYRFSPVRVAQRVLLAKSERVGLITNGVELRLLLCDPARPDSQVEIDLNLWRRLREAPPGYLLLVALASPAGVAAIPEIIEQARLQQNRVTKELRVQARLAVEEFVQCVLDHPDNVAALAAHTDKPALAKALWHEGLILIYRLLFVFKCESTSDVSRVFGFAGTSLWRNTYSPSTALARVARLVLDDGAQSGSYLEDGLRVLFRVFTDGVEHPGFTVRPLGGALFGPRSTPLLSGLRWGERAVAHLLDRLLWTTSQRGRAGRERVHYGPLDVEDLGRVYEALLELEPGISTELMCRLRRAKLEVVVPAAQGEKYKPAAAAPNPANAGENSSNDDGDDNEDSDGADEETPARGKKTKVEWIEEIKPGRFHLRVGLGRKSSGSYYTPHSFVRFLVQETLGPQCAERSPPNDPHPGAILSLKVLDPACGSGHFLVEACRFLAGKLYEAARQCDEQAAETEAAAELETDATKRRAHVDKAAELRARLKDLPDNDDELLAYLPSRSAGAGDGILSHHDDAKAQAICRRLVAVHCLYGVDKNPLAVELAKLSIWIEAHAEGLPLTFLDHRLVLGDSLTGPFWDKLIWYPGKQEPIKDLFRASLDMQFTQRLGEALALVRQLDAGVGIDVDEVVRKQAIKADLDRKLMPFRILAAAWSGGVMLGTELGDGEPRCDDDAYADLLRHVGTNGELPVNIDNQNLLAMIAIGLGVPVRSGEQLDPRCVANEARPALSFNLIFPEVFHPTGQPNGRHGFDAVIGNPPWDAIQFKSKEFLASYDIEILNATTKKESRSIEQRLLNESGIREEFGSYCAAFEGIKRANDVLYVRQKIIVDGELAGRQLDLFRVFLERMYQALRNGGSIGLVVPGGFHANDGAAGVRRLWLVDASAEWCISFTNEAKLFDIGSGQTFDLLIAVRKAPIAGHSFKTQFGLVDPTWLFTQRRLPEPLEYPVQLVTELGGDYCALVELRSNLEAEITRQLYAGRRFADEMQSAGVRFNSCPHVLHMSHDSHRFVSTERVFEGNIDPRDGENMRDAIARGIVPLHEKGTIDQYDERARDQPRYCVNLTQMGDRAYVVKNAAFYRLCHRRKIHAGESRKLVIVLLSPGGFSSDGNNIETGCSERPNYRALLFAGVGNSHLTGFVAHRLIVLNLGMSILRRLPWASLQLSALHLVVHGSLRLVSSHTGYAPLWREQLGDEWREAGKPAFTWPVLASDDDRWAVRAAIDAVVADAYGLSRHQYVHVLSTFSHSSYKKAPDLCLAAFDEVRAVGVEAFCKKHDPYWDIPLNENLPQPVIDLPIPEAGEGARQGSTGGGRGRKKSNVDNGPALWEQKDGQLTLEPPGPLFDAPDTAAGPRGRSGSAPAQRDKDAPLDPGKVLAVRTLLELRKTLTTADVQDHLTCDAPTARAILKYLSEQGVATIEGKARGTKYRLKSDSTRRDA